MNEELLKFRQQVIAFCQTLDRLNYYEALGLSQDATSQEIKEAFYRAVSYYHPDYYSNVDAEFKKQIYYIFKRMNEAYRALTQPDDRKRYDKGLKKGKLRLETQNRLQKRKKKAIDTLKTSGAKEFYKSAMTAMKSGDLKKAKLNFEMALNLEGGRHKMLEKRLNDLRKKAKQKT